ncbi:MAG: PglD-related sugar-binding protein [Candidatus Aquicultorales bacterium]
MLVYGSRDFGRVVKDLVIRCGHEFVGYIDDRNTGDGILGPYDEVSRSYPSGLCEIAMGIGYLDLSARWSVYQQVLSDGYELPALIHPNAYVRDREEVGRGAIVMAGAAVDVYAKVEELVVLWPGAVINHDSCVGANTFVSPNATVCGFTDIGRDCFIGAGATIVDRVWLPAGSFVKAGSVYSSNRLAPSTRG